MFNPKPMKIIILLLLLFIRLPEVVCQTVSVDPVFSKFISEREFVKRSLMRLRFNSAPDHILLLGIPSSYGFPDSVSTTIYKGVDVSYFGVMSDSAVVGRIIGLLKNEFYEGELDSLVSELVPKKYGLPMREMMIRQDEAKRKLLETPFLLNPDISGGKIDSRWSFIWALVYVKSDYVDKIIADMFCNPRYAVYSDVLCNVILAKDIQPYAGEIIEKCRYREGVSYDEQVQAIDKLEMCRSQYACKLISEYLLSKQFYLRDLNDFRDVSALDNSVNVYALADTTWIPLDFSSLPPDDDDDKLSDDVDYGTETCYVYQDAYSSLKYLLRNKEFQRDGVFGDLWSQLDDEKVRLQLYEWMQQNYGRYLLRLRW